MLEPNFVLPDPEISKAETQRRLALIDWFTEYIKSSVTGLLVTGSMAYGQNHSVKPTSDLDLQLLINKNTIENLLKTDCFDAQELKHAIDGYKKGLYGQFSLVFEKDSVPMECHFWDEQAFIDAVSFETENTKRLRSSVDTPSTDYGYSFDREENKKDYFGEMVDGYGVADFPSFRRIDGRLFLCRPITNILSIPIIQITTPQLDAAMEECWIRAVQELKLARETQHAGLDELSIANTLPGKNKVSDETMNGILDNTNTVFVYLDK